MTGTAHPLTLGILGGGQLGRMTALAAIPLGIHVRFLVPEPSPVLAPFRDVTVGDWTRPEVLRAWSQDCDAVTAESEWAPLDRLARAHPEQRLGPTPETIQTIRHKGVQNDALKAAGLPLPPYRRCATLEDAQAAAEALGYPVLLKRYQGSYDGYGNATVRDADALGEAWSRLAQDDGALVEGFVDFARELSVLVARRADGEHVVYPVAYTEQRDHRCHAVVAPAPGLGESLKREAVRVGLAAVEAVGGTGLVAVELFETASGEILVNELAPRPHNTGHYSIEACAASQFENHARAVLGLPLGDTRLRTPAAVMVNVLGQTEGPASLQGLDEALKTPGASVHDYGKATSRPRRKMGHVTVLGTDPAETRARAERAAAQLRF